jgi:hypothetical protein
MMVRSRGAMSSAAVAALLLLGPDTSGQPNRPASVAQDARLRTDELQRLFKSPPDDSRIMMRWWWFGPAVTKAGLEREMRLMKEGGIGGFEVQPVYPVALDDESSGIRNLSYLSDEFIGLLGFTAEKARELGLRMDLTLGSGWPFGGPQIPISQAAGRLRVERVKVAAGTRRVPLPDVGNGERLIAVFLARLEGQTIVANGVREISEARDGAVLLPAALEGPHEIQFFIASCTGMMVKRAAIGAEGFVLDHYDRSATDRYLSAVGDRLFQAFRGDRPYAVFCDSLEVFASDWTSDLLGEFERRRGYDLRPHLPALVADMGPKTTGVRHDWGRTLTELLDERFLVPMQEWSRRNGTRFRLQGYGIPPATIASNAHADLPEGEGAQWKVLRASRWASSASHLYGRPVTSSETWTWLHSPSFRATPLDVKAEADLHFLQGINQLIGHGWPYTADGVAYPGWRFYAAGVFNDKNPWWIAMPDLSLYLQRLSFLLRQGRPANDVAFYLPNSDAWGDFTAGKVHMIQALSDRLGPDVVARVLEAGFNLDFFDDGALASVGRVEGGGLVLGGNTYRAVILPGVESIPVDTYRRLESFARGGGVLVATRRTPEAAPGFMVTQADHDVVRDISQKLFRAAPAPGLFVEDENKDLAAKLSLRLRPDVSLSPAIPEIGFVHRTTSDAQIYFLANTSSEHKAAAATFRVDRLRAEWWDPLTGRAWPAQTKTGLRGGLTVALDLPPYGSRVLVFSNRALPQTTLKRARVLPAPVDLSRGWRVTFEGGKGPLVMDQLQSWTEDEDSRYFSGVAAYERTVDVAEGWLEEGLAARIDFGGARPIPDGGPKARFQAWLEAPVREAAVVYVNDRRAGAVFCPPYSLDVSGLLRRGENKLRILVGNLAINHMAGRALPDYRLLNLRYGLRFEPQDMDKLQPVPAGLLGPIRLIAEAATAAGR